MALYSNKSDDSNEKLKKYFLKVAGSDKEVDWMDLKKILDFAMKGIFVRYYIISYEFFYVGTYNILENSLCI